MIRWLVGGIGLICGMLSGTLILLQNPLALLEDAATPTIPNASQLVVSSRLGRGVPDDPEGLLGLGPVENRAFSDGALRYARLAVAVLDSPDTGARALALKLAAVGADNSLLRRRLFMDGAWNLVWPGHGSLFLIGRDDYRELLAEEIWNALRGEGFQASPQPHPLTKAARLRGAGGRLTLAEGAYLEYWDPSTGTELELGLAED